jgi:hypothetical protein
MDNMSSTSEESMKMSKKVQSMSDERFSRSDGQFPAVENLNYEVIPDNGEQDPRCRCISR